MSTFINLYQNQIKKLQEELKFILEENKILRRTLKEGINPNTPYDPNADDDNDGIPNRDDDDDDGDGLKDYEDTDHPLYDPPGGGGGGGDYPTPYDDDVQFFPGWYWNEQFLQWLQQNYPEWFAEAQDNIRARQEADPDGDGIPNPGDEDDDGDGIPDRLDPDHEAYDPPGGGGRGGRGNAPTSGKYRLPGTTPLDGFRDPITGIYYSGWYGGHSPDHPRWRPPEPPPGGGGGGGGGFGSGGGGFYTGGGKDGKDGDKK